MEGQDGLDQIDRNILRILFLYEDLNVLQLWYELGESDSPGGRMAGEEILDRLKSLSSQGFVECLIEMGEGIRWALSSKVRGARKQVVGGRAKAKGSHSRTEIN